jgi:hypothetical protein
LFTTPHFPPTVSAIICTRTESEVAEVFASFSLKFGCTNHLPFAVSAIICTRTESEVAEVFDSLSDIGGIEFYSFNTVGQLLRHMLLKGTLQDHTVLQDRLRRILGDLTFAEAYQRSGRILNVMVSAADTREPPRLLNYLTAPNVSRWQGSPLIHGLVRGGCVEQLHSSAPLQLPHRAKCEPAQKGRQGRHVCGRQLHISACPCAYSERGSQLLAHAH